MMRIRLGLVVTAALLAACSGERTNAPVAAAPAAVTLETMHPQTGQVVGSREGHGGHDGYEAPALGSLGGAFKLVEATKGEAFSDADLRGQWALVYFGYMECLEACPIALKSMPAAIAALKADGIPTRAVFVDINAPRLDDTTGGMGHGEHGAATAVSAHAHGDAPLTGPEIRRQAIAKWGPQVAPDMIFLSGSRKEVGVAVKAFQSRIEAAMLKNDEPIHHINHTTNIYVLDPYGRVAGVAYHSDSVKVIADTVKKLKAEMPAPSVVSSGAASSAPAAAAPATPAPEAHGSHG